MYDSMEQINNFLKGRQRLGIQPGLTRMKKLLSLLGNPQGKFKAVHVAGTNGKGSTIHFMELGLLENNYRVGVFTSPSMSDVKGHIYLNKKSILSENFIDIFNKVIPQLNKMDQEGLYATEFEILTAMAFMYFENNVDIALIETGMGGKEDTTNCITPILSIITSIGLDHTAFLGDTIEQIASHKAGIIKNTIPVIIGEMQSDAIQVMRKEAELKNASFYQLGENFAYSDVHYKKVGQSYLWSDDKHVFDVNLLMNGLHQVKNSSIALKALLLLKTKGFPLCMEEVFKQLMETQLEGRFEQVLKQPCIILDGAHNPDGIESFVDLILKRYQDSTKTLIFGAFKDKDIKQMLKILIPYFDHIMLTTFDHPRSADEIELKAYMIHPIVEVIEEWKPLITEITNGSPESNQAYFVTGSMNFITQVRSFLLHQ